MFNFVFQEIFLEFRKIQNYFVKILRNSKFWKIILNFAKFMENFAKHEIKNFAATLCMTGVRGEGAGWYIPGATSALTQIVHYSSSYYTVFHSVIYNSVEISDNFKFREQSKFWVTMHF